MRPHMIYKKIGENYKLKQNIINYLNSGSYEKISKDFKTYGEFINFCIFEKISTKSQDRRKILFEIKNNN